MFAKYMEETRKTYEPQKPVGGEEGYIDVSKLLRILGDIDHMQAGTMFTLVKDQRIAVDNFSQNRVVSVDVGQKKRFLMTNTVMQLSRNTTTLLVLCLNNAPGQFS